MRKLSILFRLLVCAAALTFMYPVVACSDDDQLEETEQTDNDGDADADADSDADADTEGDGSESDGSEEGSESGSEGDEGDGTEGDGSEGDGSEGDGSEDDGSGDETEGKIDTNDGVMKILAIGNSFSQDAVEQYLYELFNAAGIEAIIGNLYIGGCSLETHWNNAEANNASYYYRKVVDGVKTETSSVTMLSGIQDENWDYISLQQVSGKSGIYSTYNPYLPNLIEYVTANATGTDMQLCLHQTWAYASNSTHSDFPNYDSDQMTMYNAIIDAVNQAATDNNISIVIPSGTAIQNGRNSYLGDTFNRDGYHLETTYGRYTAACTWYEKLSGNDVTATTYWPSTVEQATKDVVTHAAHYAVQNPGVVNEMADYQAPAVEDEDLANPVYIDFGSSTATGSPWNDIAVYSLGSEDTPLYLANTEGQYTSLSITSLSGFGDMYNGPGGEPEADFDLGGITWPRSAWRDGIMLSGTAGSDTDPATIVISGFDPAATYDFNIIAVRYNGSATARASQFTLTGSATSDSQTIYTGLKSYTEGSTDLSGYIASFDAVSPASDGTITVSAVGLNTGSTVVELHVNAMTITKTAAE